MSLNVGIGEHAVSRDTGEVLKTFALGSCVGVMCFDPDKKIAGLIHIALPDSTINPQKAESQPGYFADTGLPIFFADLRRLGAIPHNLRIKICGGSNIMDASGRFDIGKRNVLAIKKILWRNQLGIMCEDVGGDISRTVSFKVADGDIRITSQGRQWEL